MKSSAAPGPQSSDPSTTQEILTFLQECKTAAQADSTLNDRANLFLDNLLEQYPHLPQASAGAIAPTSTSALPNVNARPRKYPGYKAWLENKYSLESGFRLNLSPIFQNALMNQISKDWFALHTLTTLTINAHLEIRNKYTKKTSYKQLKYVTAIAIDFNNFFLDSEGNLEFDELSERILKQGLGNQLYKLFAGLINGIKNKTAADAKPDTYTLDLSFYLDYKKEPRSTALQSNNNMPSSSSALLLPQHPSRQGPSPLFHPFQQPPVMHVKMEEEKSNQMLLIPSATGSAMVDDDEMQISGKQDLGIKLSN